MLRRIALNEYSVEISPKETNRQYSSDTSTLHLIKRIIK